MGRDKSSHIKTQMCHSSMISRIDELAEKYPFLSVTSIGESVLGKSIPMLSIGNGSKTVLYVGAHRAGEWQSSALLLRLAEEMCESYGRGTDVYSLRSVNIIPMLNPDGIGMSKDGIDEHSPISQMLETRGISFDRESWSANACGVDLYTNYCETFDAVRLEPMENETASLRNYLMFNDGVRLVISIMKGERCVCRTCGDTYGSDSIGLCLASLSSSPYESTYVRGTLSAFCKSELDIREYDIFSEFSNGSDWFYDYARLRRALLHAPKLI